MADKDGVSDSIVREALEQFEDSEEGSQENRQAYYEDVKFARLSDQWPVAIEKQRTQEGRPVHVVNKLPALIRAVVNESRQNKPAIKVSPVDSGADEDTAEVIGGLIRSIERGSNAEVAYDTALDNAVTGGFGFFRIGIDYAGPDTFDLEARIDRVPNALMVHWDTSSTEFDASDWNFAFVSDMMQEDEYKSRYPKGSTVPFDGDSRNDASSQWINDDYIRVAEYFQRTRQTRKLVEIAVPNPQTGEIEMQAVRRDELPTMARRFAQAGQIDVRGMNDDALVREFMRVSGVEVRRERDAEFHKVMRRIINGVEVLEEDEWPGSSIPICPVWGDETFLDGRRNFRSMIRDAKDSQQMANFWKSASTELVALAPKAPWIGPQGFIPKGHEAKWASANTRSHAYLEYTEGKAPSRQAFAGVPAGVLQETINANEDMQAITGIYPSSIGARSNETSGRAILARERQGNVSNFHFIDNLSRSIRYAGQVFVEIIPAIYSARQTIRILGQDEKDNVVKLTQEAGGGKGGLYNLSVGKYDVTVSTGPSFATEREQTRETLVEIMKQVPSAAPFVGDVLLDHMDFVGADKIAKRLKNLLPPEIRKAEEAADGSDNPEAAALQQQLQAKDAEMQQAQQAVMQEMQKLNAENEQLKADNAAEMQKVRDDATLRSRELDRAAQQRQDDMVVKDKEIGVKRAEVDAKKREIELREAEAETKRIEAMNITPEPVVSTEEQWEYDRRMLEEKNEFAAREAEKDRQAELVKAVISKSEGKNEADLAEMVSAILGNGGSDALGVRQSELQELREHMIAALAEISEASEAKSEAHAQAMMNAMDMVAAKITAPKRVIYDDDDNPIGVETM